MKPDMQTCMEEEEREEEEVWGPARPGFLRCLVEVLTYGVNGKEKQSVMLKILPDIERAGGLSPCVCSSI